MRRLICLLLSIIMAATIFVVPVGVSHAEPTTPSIGSSEEGPNGGTSTSITDNMVSMEANSFAYTGSEIKPEITVMNGETTLIEGTDYNVEYTNNINVGTAQAIITGIGTYSGTVTKTFAVIPADLSAADIVLSQVDFDYTKAYHSPAVTVMIGETVIDASNYDVSYKNNKYPGIAKVVVTGKNNFMGTSVEESFYISRIDKYEVKDRNRKSVKIKWSYEKNVTGYKVYRKKSGKWKLLKTIKGAKNTVYTIKDLTPGTAYNVRVRPYVGTNYGSNVKTLWVSTRPSQVELKSLTTAPDLSMTVRWNKRNSTGYQVAVSRYSDFRKKDVYTIESNSATSKKINDLVDGKRYYVKVRAYKYAGGVNTYGSWSDKKSAVAKETGWLTKDGYKYYYVNGKKLTGRRTIDGKKYYFGTDSGRWLGLSYKMWTKVRNQSSKTKWLIAVSRPERRIVVYTGSKGKWKPKYYWKCTVGAKSTPTPAGSFTVPSKNTYQYAFGRDQGYMAWYSTKIKGPYLFHSVLYQPGSKTVFYDGRLGMALSHGCIRVALTNAIWIQENIKPGTKVVIY